MTIFLVTGDRVHWFRERAAIGHLIEEVELLEEEFRRTISSFTVMADTWAKLATTNLKKAGFSSYAYRTSAMYKQLAEDCEVKRKVVCSSMPT